MIIFFGGRSSNSERPARPGRMTRVVSKQRPCEVAAPGQPVKIDWIGAGTYYLQSDNVVRHHRALLKGYWVRTYYFASKNAVAPTMVLCDGDQVIGEACARLGLPVANSYSNMSQQQIDALVRIAEVWNIPYCWSAVEQKRILKKSFVCRVFTAQFSAERKTPAYNARKA